MFICGVFFFKQKTAYEMRISDWSSDVCSSDLIEVLRDGASAQYGSDAIAGVINVILKTNDSGGKATLEAGQRYGRDGSGSDGETISGSVSQDRKSVV